MNGDIRNCIDAWALLYSCIAQALDQKFGADGRSVLRRSIRGYAAERGSRRKDELRAESLSVDLRNLCTAGCDFPIDHRTEVEWIKTAPQELFANVAHCPMAKLWADTGVSDLGCIYCEEFYHAYFKSALFHKVQVNLTQMMTHERDELCRFSLYLRPANLDETQRAVCFREGRGFGRECRPRAGKRYDQKPVGAVLHALLRQYSGRIRREGALGVKGGAHIVCGPDGGLRFSPAPG